MTAPQPAALPELPEPSLQQGKYGYRLSHEDYYTTDQMRARDAMWAERIAALQPQPKPAAAVSDAEIDAVIRQQRLAGWFTFSDGPRAFARAILALRPQAVPMTDLDVALALSAQPMLVDIACAKASEVMVLVRAVEAHHRITAQGAQGGEG